ncbi:sulfite exporter TauE/SafE family protein [Rubellimicrobium sp. CFH 75288]|uniref:sulfite exporter TauE/SafE family protein n=1 Tax=Rubellimicrobium sp. CFH 75288 TaxID=2697034 RepID=UPI001FB80232|nr:sulfite exporter TauE/SafE family protein [Rubellimicrobium sp. CFH 75288]
MSASRLLAAALAGAAVGLLGGLIGLGGAEFRLPLLIALFGLPAFEAVLLNKVTSLVVVAVSLPARAGTVPWAELWASAGAALNLLGGSLLGAWTGAGWVLRLRERTLHRVLSLLLAGLAAALLLGHGLGPREALLSGPWQVAAGLLAGWGIGVVASVMGVAGGELLIPTLILLFGTGPALAGSLSLAVSLPTMVVGLLRYARDPRLGATLAAHRALLLALAAGSVLGALLGGRLLGHVPEAVLLPLLVLILLVSAWKLWRP